MLCGKQYSIGIMCLLRLLQGAAFIVFQISLGSTILIDITDTSRRDVTTYLYYWSCRFSLALGPLICLLFSNYHELRLFFYLPIAFAVISFLLLISMKVPFRTPLDKKLFSRDRFLLAHSARLILVLFPVSAAVGIMMALNTNMFFYINFFGGLVAALVLHFVVFRQADTRAEIASGLILLLASFLLIIFGDNDDMILVSSALAGYGMGAVCGRLQSFFTAISDHTERGSAQTTYKLTFEFGLCLGLFTGTLLCHFAYPFWSYRVGLGLIVVSLLFYLTITHKWFLAHVQR